MPPRFAYWTIILDGVPTSFRAREQAELQPTFNQLKRKNPGALMKWFSGGKLWDSPEQAREERQLSRVRQFRDQRDRQTKEHRQPRDAGMRGVDPRAAGPRAIDRPERAAAERPQLDGDDPQTVELRKRIAERAAAAPQTRQDERPREPQERERPGDSVKAPREHPPAIEGRPRPPRRADHRPKDWRPGGEHRDPRDKYKLPPGEARKRWKQRHLGPTGAKPFGTGTGSSRPPGPGGDRPPRKDFSRPPGKSFSKPSGPGGFGGDRPPRKDFSRPPGKSFSKPSGPGGFGGDRPPRKDFSRPPGKSFSRPPGKSGVRGPGKGPSRPPGRGRR